MPSYPEWGGYSNHELELVTNFESNYILPRLYGWRIWRLQWGSWRGFTTLGGPGSQFRGALVDGGVNGQPPCAIGN